MSPKKKPRTEPEPDESDFITTTFRLTKEQWGALRREALELSLARGAGRADASEALRGILDEWMKRQR